MANYIDNGAVTVSIETSCCRYIITDTLNVVTVEPLVYCADMERGVRDKLRPSPTTESAQSASLSTRTSEVRYFTVNVD